MGFVKVIGVDISSVDVVVVVVPSAIDLNCIAAGRHVGHVIDRPARRMPPSAASEVVGPVGVGHKPGRRRFWNYKATGTNAVTSIRLRATDWLLAVRQPTLMAMAAGRDGGLPFSSG